MKLKFSKKTKTITGVIFLSALLFNLPGCHAPNKNIENTEESISYKVGHQLEKPEPNEEVAVVETNVGNFKIRFFPQEAPKAVENFKKLSKSGYYDNVTFHRVIKDFMVQSGDPDGTGMGGESIWKKDFEDEFSKSLFNITGAVSMANRGPNTNGSQFFINNQDPKHFRGWNEFEQYYNIYKKSPEAFTQAYGGTVDMSQITDEIKKLYIDNGGSPSLDGYYNTSKKGHTVFGQVFEGMDTINKISESKTDENDKPTEPVVIKKISFEYYKKQ